MLRSALNVNWKTHMTNKELYGDIPQITAKIKARRLTLAGHCKRGRRVYSVKASHMATDTRNKVQMTPQEDLRRSTRR